MFNNRILNIELMRFIVAIAIILFHVSGTMVPSMKVTSGYIGVEFFFIISGFFMMQRALKEKPLKTTQNIYETIKYVFNKAKKIWPFYIFALMFMLIIKEVSIHQYDILIILKDLYSYKLEFFYLQCLGFNSYINLSTSFLLVPAWYLSSLFIALIPIYFISKIFKKKFSGIIAPIIAIIIYAYLLFKFGKLDVILPFNGFTIMGNLRAVAGICLGAFFYHLFNLSNSKINKILKFIDPIAWIIILFMLFIIPLKYSFNYIVPTLICFGIIILNGINNQGIISKTINKKGNKLPIYLGQLSLYIYLLHQQMIIIWINLIHPNLEFKQTILCVILSTILLSIIIMQTQIFLKKKLT